MPWQNWVFGAACMTVGAVLVWWIGVRRSDGEKRQDIKQVTDDPIVDALEETRLDKAAALVRSKARKAADWYHDARWWKRRLAITFRFMAIVLTVASGLVPVIVQMIGTTDGTKVLWASVMLGAAGLFVALDRFGDCSRGWVRYVIAATRITGLTDVFILEWRAFRAAWPAGAPGTEQTAEGYAKCVAFITAINGICAEETNVWATEFQSVIQQLDADLDRAKTQRAAAEAAELKAAKDREAAKEAGGLNVSILGADKLDGPWTLTVGGRKEAGTTSHCGLAPVGPGIVTVAVSGLLGGKPVGTSKVVEVPSGKTVAVELSLTG